MHKSLLLFLLFFITNSIFAQEKLPKFSKRVGLIATFWNEPAIKPGLVLGTDWEFMNNEGHGVAVTFPQFLFFYFPDNYFSFSAYPSVSYRFVHPKNGFYTSLTTGFGYNGQWKTVPLYSIEGIQIKDSGFHRMIAIGQWDVGYDFETVLNTPLRLFLSLGWNGIFPNNLSINNHFMLQLGVNVKLKNL